MSDTPRAGLHAAVVDDEAPVRRLVASLLEERGHAVEVFENGLEAFNATLVTRFDVVVSDLNMPVLRGDELCARIKEALGHRAPPVVIVSGVGDEEGVGRALDAGALHFIQKPFGAGQLLAIVERAARKAIVEPLADPAAMPRRLGAFEIRGELGRGGMGRVFLAERGGHQVALKVLPARLTNVEDHLRFRRELDILSSLEHPGIPRVLETGTADGWVYFAMELVPGKTIHASLATDGPCPWPRAAKLGRDVAATLAYVHGRGLIHRDVKPANVVVTDDDQPVLIDFGVARRPHDLALTAKDSILGTTGYLAPELLDASPGPPSDIFALGITLHEMLLGRHPILTDSDQNPLTTLRLYSEGRIPALHATAPPRLARLVARMEYPSPSLRPTAVEVAAELGKVLSDVVGTG